MNTIPRTEYPRPQFVRSGWINLNGEWDFSFDSPLFDKKILVPFVYQSKKSGIGRTEGHDEVWYKRSIVLDNTKTKKTLLHFGAVDYRCEVRVNGAPAGVHEGGHISFTMDISNQAKDGENEITVRVWDGTSDLEIPRGKQYWKDTSEGIFYTRSTGIWQTVWIEQVEPVYLRKVYITPDLDKTSVEFSYEIEGADNCVLSAAVSMKGAALVETSVKTTNRHGSFTVLIDQRTLKNWNFQEDLAWSPENPRLFDVRFSLTYNNKAVDEVDSYFGMRKVSIENGIFMLNNRPYYQKLLLDQGYWPDSLLTAPEDDAFAVDIQLAKEMGFNGVRKHQKIEDPRFMHLADTMGFLVWGEIAAAYVYSREYVRRITDEWIDEINRDYNHPSIVVWTPINESWGVFNIKDSSLQQAHSAAMVHLTKSLDSTRPVISNDGWEHTCTDILTIHDYESRYEVIKKRYSSMENILDFAPGGRLLFAHGWKHEGQPVMVTEFGGISYRKGEQEGWGYSNAVSDEDFVRRYHDVVAPLLQSPLVQGFCYTELTDVEQEINGLYTADRKPKADPATIAQINRGEWKPAIK